MNISYPTSQIWVGILLIVGTIILPFIIKVFQKESHLNLEKTERLQHRAWSNRALATLLISWLSLYLLAAGIGSFFYEDQLHMVQWSYPHLYYVHPHRRIHHPYTANPFIRPIIRTCQRKPIPTSLGYSTLRRVSTPTPVS